MMNHDGVATVQIQVLSVVTTSCVHIVSMRHLQVTMTWSAIQRGDFTLKSAVGIPRQIVARDPGIMLNVVVRKQYFVVRRATIRSKRRLHV